MGNDDKLRAERSSYGKKLTPLASFEPSRPKSSHLNPSRGFEKLRKSDWGVWKKVGDFDSGRLRKSRELRL